MDGDDEGLADRIAQAATMAMEQLGLTIKDITSVGVGTPGAVDTVNGVVVYANNLGFRNTPSGNTSRTGCTPRSTWKTTRTSRPTARCGGGCRRV